MKYTKYREFLEKTAREIKGEPEPLSTYEIWEPRIVVAAIILLPLYLIIRSLIW